LSENFKAIALLFFELLTAPTLPLVRIRLREYKKE